MEPKARPSASVGSANKSRKKVLEEKVDNRGNQGGTRARAACSKRIFTEDTKGPKSRAAAVANSRTPCKSSSGMSSGSPPVKRRRKSKGAASGVCDADLSQPSCSKYNPTDTENTFRPTWHADINVTEYCPSSDSEYDLHSIDMGGYDIEFVESETEQKQDTSSDLDKGSNRTCGPIPGPGHDLFSGYVFVVSHASEGPVTMLESDGNLSDQQFAELSTKFPFRRRRLERQLTKGGGTVYPSLNLVPHEKLDNCLLITNRPSKTCNFILALAMRVPVLHYYYVIQCCITKSHIRRHRLPEMCSGYSLEEKCLQDRNLTSANILGEYFIVVAMSAKRHALVFWEKVLKFAGASVKQWHPKYNWDGLPSISSNMIVAILVDDDIPEEVLAQPYDRILPVWIIQSLIHAKARDFDAHPDYRPKGMNTSETY
uniref:Tumor suppressor p53-binding protein 1 n=2 Tax=Cacopsylla melanoneura TaxID=428564 RepID=A0A8D8PY16_9HEMI